MTRSIGTPTLVAATAAVAVVLLAVASASAHAVLIGSSPRDGQVLEASPGAVVLQFSESVSALDGGMSLSGPDGAMPEIEAPIRSADGASLTVPLPSELGDGTWILSWGVLSADGHPVRGALVFHIGEPSPGAVAPSASGDPGWLDPTATAARAIQYLLALVAAGAAIFATSVAPPGTPQHHRARSIARPVLLAALLFLPFYLASQSLRLTAGEFGPALSPGGLGDLLRSTAGDEFLLLAPGLAIAAALLWLGASTAAVRAGAITAVLAICGFALSGHTVSSSPRALVTAVDAVHGVVAAAWLGGLATLGVILVRSRTGDGDGVVTVVRRFSLLAAGSVVVLVAAGAILAWSEVRSFDNLATSGYGRLLIAKTALAGCVVAVAAYNNRRLVPGVANAIPSALRRLRLTVAVEAAVLVGVVALTAQLVDMNPARNRSLALAAPGASGPVTLDAFITRDFHLVLTITPDPEGGREFDAVFHPLGEVDPSTIQGATLVLELSANGIGPLERELERAPDGHFRYAGPEIAAAGDWEVTVIARVSDFDEARTMFEVPLAP